MTPPLAYREELKGHHVRATRTRTHTHGPTPLPRTLAIYAPPNHEGHATMNLPKIEAIKARLQKAHFHRRDRGKYSSMTWDDGMLGFTAANALAELMDRTAAPALRAMYNHHRDQLPRTSTLYAAGANGYWIGCPRDLADEAERMVKAVQLVASLDHRASRCIQDCPADRGSSCGLSGKGTQSRELSLVTDYP